MPEITFHDKENLDFLRQLTEKSYGKYIEFKEQTGKIENPIIANLISELNDEYRSVIPILNKKHDEWLVLAPTKVELDQTLQQLNRFIIPSYGTFSQKTYPQLQPFETCPDWIFDHYYTFISRPEDREVILNTLQKWLTLSSQVPNLSQMFPPNFKELYREFKVNINNQQWDGASQIIEKIRRNNLTSSHNLAFLKVELLAQQEDYSIIWNDNDLKKWVFHSVPIPRRVQVAFLRAFHHEKLLIAEQAEDYEQVISLLRQDTSALGNLLKYRNDIIDDVVVRVFAYFSIINKTPEQLEILSQIKSLTDKSKNILERLKSLIEPVQKISELDRFRELLQKKQFETALNVAQTIENEVHRIASIIEASAHLKEPNIAQDALTAFKNLSSEKQEKVKDQNIYITLSLDSLKTIAPEKNKLFADWLSWFDAIFSEGANTDQLYQSLEYLEQESDKEYWTLGNVVSLYEEYLGFMEFNPHEAPPEDTRITSQAYFQQAMKWLIDQFLGEDKEFPRDQEIYHNLYNIFLQYLLHNSSVNDESADKIFRLADNRLGINPNSKLDFYKNIFYWIGEPRPEASNIALEAFELCIRYGIGKEYIYDNYRYWIEILMDVPITYNNAELQVWQSIGHWFGTDAEYLVQKISERLRKDSYTSIDPISDLPDGYFIVLYTLDESTARRVQNILQERNQSLRVEICSEKSVSDKMMALTKSADMHVLVWRCMKHNVYYGVKKHIANPVLPSSRGSTSIIREIEDFVQ